MKDTPGNNAFDVLKWALPFLGLFVLGWLLPESMWGIHFSSLLPAAQQWVFVLAFVIVFFLPWVLRVTPRPFTTGNRVMLLIWPVTGALIMGGMMVMFPLVSDAYGDAFFLKPGTEKVVTEMTDMQWSYLLSFDLLDPKVGGKTMMGLVSFVSWIFGISGAAAYQLVDLVSGMLFVFLWSRLVVLVTDNSLWRWILVLAGCLAPFTFMFYGHIENYSLAVALMMGYLLEAWLFFGHGRTKYLVLLWVLALLGIKLHVTGFLLVPLTLVAMMIGFRDRLSDWLKIGSLRDLFRKLLLPASVLGLVVYFLKVSASGSKRSYTEDTLEDVLFIPFSSSEPAPLDRYNLLSGAHLSDYLNLILTWSAAILLLLVLIVVLERKRIQWGRPVVLFALFAAFVYMSVFFVLNPLLGMSLDWDLFALPAPFFLFLGLVLFSEVHEKPILHYAWGPVLALVMTGIPVLLVHSDRTLLANRLELVGKWHFKTYWISGSYPLRESVMLQPEDEQETARLRIFDELKPFAVEGNDIEFAELACELSEYYVEKDSVKAGEFLTQAAVYKNDHWKLPYNYVRYYFASGNAAAARHWINPMLSMGYPDERTTLGLAVDVNIAARDTSGALHFGEAYLNQWPDDEDVVYKMELLNSGIDH